MTSFRSLGPCTLQIAVLAVIVLGAGCAWHPPAYDFAVPPQPVADKAARFAQPVAPFTQPDDDAFHAQPIAAELADMAPGRVLRYRPISPEAYYFFGVNARAWQVAYVTADGDGKPQVDIATLLVPDDPQPRLLAYQVAYDALTRRCAPSYEMLSGSMVEHMLVDKALRRGWVVVIPDYEGPESQFLAGRNSGQGVLDAIRAAQAFLPDRWVNTETPVALWGYSGGAYASLWAAQIAADYAPTIPLVGVAAGGPPADLASSAEAVNGGIFAGMYFAAVVGLSRAYDSIDTETLMNEDGREMMANVGESCIGQELAWVKDPVLSYAFDNMQDYTTVDNLLAVPAVQKVIAENRLGQQGFAAPLFYYQAFFDQVTPRTDAKTLAATYCAAGVPAVSFSYALGEHISAALTHGSAAVAYLADRFDGESPPNECAELMQMLAAPD